MLKCQLARAKLFIHNVYVSFYSILDSVLEGWCWYADIGCTTLRERVPTVDLNDTFHALQQSRAGFSRLGDVYLVAVYKNFTFRLRTTVVARCERKWCFGNRSISRESRFCSVFTASILFHDISPVLSKVFEELLLGV